MTGQDVDRLFDLLAIFRPKDKHLEDQALRNAWMLVLKPYEPKDVREAVAEYFRESSYWPDVTDIAKRCPKVLLENSRQGPPPDTDRHWKRQQEWAERYNDLKRRRLDAGLPETWWEAKEAGFTVEEYDKLLDEADLGMDMIL